MKIVFEQNNRILIKDNNEKIKVNNNDIIEYTGIYYKKLDTISEFAEIQTIFIGKIETYRGDTIGITGIYIIPLYIWDNLKREWYKIANYQAPKYKEYFVYPHLLMLPEKDYHYKPLYFLHTCKNRSLDEFYHITKEFYL